MKHSWNVTCEVMRLVPPLQGAFRQAVTDFMYAGCTVPKGWKVVHTYKPLQNINYAESGFDGVNSAITFTAKYLAEFPHIYDLVYREQMDIAKSKAPAESLNWEDIQKMKYSWNVASEVMRLVPPSPGVFREALHEFMYAGFTIPKGWKLQWSAYTTHLNPEYFPNPEKFDPTRFEGKGPDPYTYVAFGGGTRLCPGRDYARLTILVYLHNMVKRFRWEKLLPNEHITVDLSPHPAKGLPIRLIPHEKNNKQN